MLVESALLCLALNIYHEARGEPTQGQLAVAQVTLRRAKHNPKRVCHEVFRPAQFTWTTGVSEKTGNAWRIAQSAVPRELAAWQKSITVAKAAMFVGKVPDFSMGADHYHTVDVRPRWRLKMVKVAQIGRHIFYRSA